MEKSLDRKLAAIHADPHGSREFILADAKDADMGFGVTAPGLTPESRADEIRYKTLAEYREQIRVITHSELVDIMLMSASTSDVLAREERLFDHSPVTPAARANDTTDIHIARGATGYLTPALPFRTATIDHMQCGHLECAADERRLGVDLALYSLTFNNDAELDRAALERFNEFRAEAERKRFRYFLEVFDPNIKGAVAPDQLGPFINDCIARTLAGVPQAGRPIFLKIVYHGPRWLEELVAYDPHLVVGILGGGSGTTRDAFQLLHDARRYGGRVALFGRKINHAECQLAFVHFLRLIADGQLEPEEAVRAYHAVLERLKIRPLRSLEADLQLQANLTSYGGGTTTISLPEKLPAPRQSGSSASVASQGEPVAGATSTEPRIVQGPSASPRVAAVPNFAAMSPDERLAYHRERLNRMFGESKK